jgi:dTDP-4-dehydrorhamnose 3,5-epimerase
MEIIKKLFKDAYIIKNKFQNDKRGKFIKFKQEIKIRNKKIKFDQFCYSSNKNKYTLRGIHYQKHPDQEEKLITCVEGKILDIIVDLNKNSKTYLNHKFINLNQNNMYSLYIGKNYAHGFLTLSKNSIILYQIKGYYKKLKQDGILWNDPFLNIKWPKKPLVISNRDKKFKKIIL